MGQITVDPGAATTDERAGPAFAHALAARDFDKLQSLLDPEVEFRALTPRRNWEANGDSPTVDLFRNWFDEATVIAFLTDRIERYKVPRTVEFTDTPLRDDAGKARRSAVRDEVIARRAQARC